MTPITSSAGATVVPVASGGVMIDVDGAGRVAPEVTAAPTAVPQTPQNFVVALIAAPQILQIILSGGDATVKGEVAVITGVPQIPQNFSVPLIGLPHVPHNGRETGGGGTSVLGSSGGVGVAGATSATFARHFLQNLSPGLIMYPHDRHTRGVPDGCEDCGAGIYWEGGGGGEKGGIGAGYGAGVLQGLSSTLARHLPQNLSPGLIMCPHDRHTRAAPGGCEGCGAGEGGTGAGGTCCRISPSLFPQVPQNFSSGPSGVPQEAQGWVASGSTAGGMMDGDSSSSEAPQFRQNFAVGATRLPHSGQNDIIFTIQEIAPALLRALLPHQNKKERNSTSGLLNGRF